MNETKKKFAVKIYFRESHIGEHLYLEDINL